MNPTDYQMARIRAFDQKDPRGYGIVGVNTQNTIEGTKGDAAKVLS